MHTNTHTSPELETVIDTWALMELRLSNAVDTDDTITLSITNECLDQIKQHPLAHELMTLPRYGPAVGINVALATFEED